MNDNTTIIIVISSLIITLLIIVIVKNKEHFLAGHYGRFLTLPYSYGVRQIKRQCNDNCLSGWRGCNDEKDECIGKLDWCLGKCERS